MSRTITSHEAALTRQCQVARTSALVLLLTLPAASARAERERLPPLPAPLRLDDVLSYARRHRQEIAAARAQARAAEQRPTIVSALEDPMISPSLDHLPFMLHGVDASVTFEQRFPLSGTLGHRGRAARADARRFRAEADRVALDVQLDAAHAYLMLWERREMARVLTKQLALAEQLVTVASARYGVAIGSQSDVLRAEIEVARLSGALRAMRAEVAASEAMLNASLGRSADGAVPRLEYIARVDEPAAPRTVQERALRHRPELDVARAEVDRAAAEISVMESMYWPMGMVRAGPAYTMTDGWGWMAMVGVSIPLWRRRLDAGVAEARAMADMARADQRAMTRMVEGEAATARHQVLAARERVLALREDVIPRARQAIEPSIAAYAAGAVPLVSVIEAVSALWSMEAELVYAELELGAAWTRLDRAQGELPRRRQQ